MPNIGSRIGLRAWPHTTSSYPLLRLFLVARMLGPEYLTTRPRSIIRYPPTLRFGEPRNLELWSRLEFRVLTRQSNPSSPSLPPSRFLILPHGLLRTLQRLSTATSIRPVPTHARAGTKVSTAKPRARTLTSRMCLLL